ncbi:MAG TPA: hypothetical protein ENO36_04990 [Fervidicoccus fontis]|uniref:Uncharacterized protein n=1 Tax=Fervidicoccus fontis TaxID=683846 RepID=A0A7C2UK04_9CREN|nr:hypothetical protein [Fervidicoccus fontis]
MLNFYPTVLSLSAVDTVPSTSNLISYIIIFLIIGLLFVVVRIACPPCRKTEVQTVPQTQAPQPPAVQAVAVPEQQISPISPQVIAVAVAAVHSFLKGKRPASPQIVRTESAQTISKQNAWILSERMNPYFREDPYFREKGKI